VTDLPSKPTAGVAEPSIPYSVVREAGDLTAQVRHLAGKHWANTLSDDEVKALYIARQDLLEQVMADIAATAPDTAPQHQLLVGLRGSGKSTLLRRIEAALRQTPLAQRFIPLAFREEHYRRVRTNRLSDFWLNCLDALANACQQEGNKPEAQRLDALIRPLNMAAKAAKADEAALAAQCKAALDRELAQTGRRPVLLMDNFPKLMQALPAHDWALRAWLQTPTSPLLIAASTAYPQELADYDGAFYDSLKTRYLSRLSLEEVISVLRELATRENRPAVLAQLQTSRPRIQALHDLTGGNPRTVIYLYHLLVGGLSNSVGTDLKRLMDEVKSMYESRLDNLPEQARSVFGELALEWRPTPARRLQELTQLTPGGLSGQLARLEELGLIDKVPLQGQKRTGYQVTERLFNVWYLDYIGSRRDHAAVESLTLFLEAFYTTDTRRRMAQSPSEKAPYAEGVLAVPHAERIEWNCFDTRTLAQSVFAAHAENWGECRTQLAMALEVNGYLLPEASRQDWFGAYAVFAHLGALPRVLAWIDELDVRHRMLPVVEALEAMVQGDAAFLLNAPVEVRPAAQEIYLEIDKRRKSLPAIQKSSKL
jgi:DNA-binding transcriptional ArsR family regulator